jgi:hypothetical protein
MAYPCYYAILQVSRSASQDVIESAYKRLAREIHPDKNLSSTSHSKMQLLNEAYEVLSNPVRRRGYDARTTVCRRESNQSEGKSRRATSSLNEAAATQLAQRLAGKWLPPAQIVRVLEKRGVDRGMAVFIVFERTDAPRRAQWQAGVAEMMSGGLILLLAAAGAMYLYARAEAVGWYLEPERISWSGKLILPAVVATMGGVKFIRGLLMAARA